MKLINAGARARTVVFHLQFACSSHHDVSTCIHMLLHIGSMFLNTPTLWSSNSTPGHTANIQMRAVSTKRRARVFMAALFFIAKIYRMEGRRKGRGEEEIREERKGTQM